MTDPATISALDDAALAAWQAEAAGAASAFIDPALFRRAQAVLAGVPAEWLSRIAGRPVGSWARLSNAELTVAVRAADADAAYLRALNEQRAAEYRAAQARAAGQAAAAAQAGRDAWQQLRSRLPVPVEVCHNWTARHLDGYEQGADHIVVLAPLNAGRLHRAEHQPLCWTPSRAPELRYVHANAGDEGRVPTCKACQRHAAALAATVAAHPSLGCGDVGCTRDHGPDEPADAAGRLALARDRAAVRSR